MTFKNREPIYIVSIIVIFLIFLGIDHLKEKQISDYQFELDHYKNEAKEFETKSGLQASRISTLEGTVENIEKVMGDSLKVLERELGLKSKKIEELINANTTTEIDVDIPIDSTGSGLVINRFFEIGVKSNTHSMNFRAIIKDSLTFVRYQHGKWYQKKTLTMDGISWSPYTRITGIKDISIKDNPNKYAVVIGPGLMYYDEKIRPTISITAGWKIIER